MKKGAFVRVEKLEAQAGAPLRRGQVFIGTLRRDLMIGIGIAIDEPGPHWLITSAIERIDVQTEKTATVKTRNSTYSVRVLDPDAPLEPKDLFQYRDGGFLGPMGAAGHNRFQ